MQVVHESGWPVAPLAIAGFLLGARTWLEKLGFEYPSVRSILESTGVSRSRAYEVRDDIHALLPGILRPPGRPPSQPSATQPTCTEALRREILGFLMDHPGCVSGGADRRRYSDEFRHRVLELRKDHAELDLQLFAEAVQIPAGTITDWHRPGRLPPPQCAAADAKVDPENDKRAADPRLVKIETVVEAWRQWHGDFTSFCEHVRHHLRLDGFGNTMIASILSTYGERQAARRKGRSPDEEAIRRTFLTFFPNAQWVGDGTEVVVTIDGEEHRFNFELNVDAYSGAFVGISVRDTEDSQSVIEAFAQGVHTAEQPPIALLLDNKPSNHTEEVAEAIGDALKMRSTAWRPQNKAHVEGAFGLFSQYAPPLTLQTNDPRELGRGVLKIVVELFARILNHRPRRDRGGKSRAELHRQTVSNDEREKAREALRERVRKQEAARAARDAHTDPAKRQLLDAAFERLGLLDPERFFRRALAGYPLDAIVDGIATFQGKLKAATLPDGVDARYLLGIVRNIHHLHESDEVTLALLRERLDARDTLLNPLLRERTAVLRDEGSRAPSVLIDRALAADRTIDRLFWIDAAAGLIAEHPADDRRRLFRNAARRIHATFRATRALRYQLERLLARMLWPLT